MPGGSSKQRRIARRALERSVGKTAAAQALLARPIPPPLERPRRPIAAYLQKIGAGSLVLGMGGIVFPVFFWWGMFLLYVSAGIWTFDLWLETALPRWGKVTIQIAVVFLVAAFTKGIVLFKADPHVTAFWAKSDYPKDSNVDGIKWNKGLSELRINIANETDRDFDDFDFAINPAESVFAINQVTSVPCDRLENNVATLHDSLSNVWQKGPSRGPLRFRCGKLPRHTTLQFLLALANTDELEQSLKSGKPGQRIGDGDLTKDGISVLFGPKRKPGWVIVTAAYTVSLRPHAGGIRLTTIGNL